MHIGQVVIDAETGDRGRIVGFMGDGLPVAKTAAGRLFNGGRDARGFRSLATRYKAGELKVCNCAGCFVLLLGSCHAEEVEAAVEKGQDTSSLPELVAGRIEDRPYCQKCADQP